jgi:hypothetical protein
MKNKKLLNLASMMELMQANAISRNEYHPNGMAIYFPKKRTWAKQRRDAKKRRKGGNRGK